MLRNVLVKVLVFIQVENVQKREKHKYIKGYVSFYFLRM